MMGWSIMPGLRENSRGGYPVESGEDKYGFGICEESIADS